jgi:hypothetical protein
VHDDLLMPADLWRWSVTLLIILLDLLWFAWAGYGVKGQASIAIFISGLAGLLILSAVGHFPRYRAIAHRPWARRAALTLHCSFALSIFGLASGVLQYLLITLNAPLVDVRLEAWDLQLGFDWAAWYYWVHQHRWANAPLTLAYVSLLPQFVAIQWYLGLSGQAVHLREFINCVMLSSLLLLALSAVFPAHSAYIYYGVGSMEEMQSVAHFDMLRHGVMRTIDLDDIQGLISIPSYHTALAVFFIYALRQSGRLFWYAMVLNTLMIASTPSAGGHYLVDTLAGLLLAWVSIVLVRWSSAVLSRAQFARGRSRAVLASE